MSLPRQLAFIVATAFLLGLALGVAYFAGRLMQARQGEDPAVVAFVCGGVL